MQKKQKKSAAKVSQKNGNDSTFPVGRTFFTNDKFLPHKDDNAYKDVNVVSIERNSQGEMIVVRVTTQKTRNSSPLNHHTYKRFKHFVEIEDSDGNPIKPGQKFKQNSSDYDLTKRQVEYIEDIVYNHVKQASTNKKLRDTFRNKKSRC